MRKTHLQCVKKRGAPKETRFRPKLLVSAYAGVLADRGRKSRLTEKSMRPKPKGGGKHQDKVFFQRKGRCGRNIHTEASRLGKTIGGNLKLGRLSEVFPPPGNHNKMGIF